MCDLLLDCRQKISEKTPPKYQEKALKRSKNQNFEKKNERNTFLILKDPIKKVPVSKIVICSLHTDRHQSDCRGSPFRAFIVPRFRL